MKTISSIDTATFIDIHGIYEPTIYEYFARLNNGEFIRAAELFAPQGQLDPPFGNPIEGRDAIAQYLEEEAKGIKFYPEEGKLLMSLNNYTKYQIQGKVEINWVAVNVSWSIQLNAEKGIMAIEVKLLASLNDLLIFNHV